MKELATNIQQSYLNRTMNSFVKNIPRNRGLVKFQQRKFQYKRLLAALAELNTNLTQFDLNLTQKEVKSLFQKSLDDI